jgi:magnesium and cobalt exporter, CNNM family
MITLYTILVLGAIMMQAFFTSSEMAFTSANRIKLKALVDKGNKYAVKLNKFLSKEGAYLGVTLVGTNIAVVVSSTLMTRIFVEYFGVQLAPILATCIMVPFTLVFAEIIPKIIARQFSLKVALTAVGPLSSFYHLFYPLIITVDSIARLLLIPFGKKETTWISRVTKSDLKKILQIGHETGEVEQDEMELIHKVLDFGSKKVESIMVPLYKVSSIGDEDITEDLKKLVSLRGFSRVPVYKGNKNNIIGIVNIYDVLFSSEEENKKIVKDFIRDPVHIDSKDGLDIALTRLRHNKQPMGIVTDEFENIVGIVTIEDILEEIVGEIEDTK